MLCSTYAAQPWLLRSAAALLGLPARTGLRGAVMQLMAQVHSAAAPYEARANLAGQPTHSTHPEFLAPGELAPGLSAAEFLARRETLARSLPRNALAIIPAASTSYITGVIPHQYRQDADFLYLTGLQQHAVAVIQAGGGTAANGTTGDHRFMLFLPPVDPQRERWDGAGVGAAAAREVFGAEEVFSTDQLISRLQQMAAASATVLFDFDRHACFQYQQIRAALTEACGLGKTQQLRPFVHRLRWVKSPAELHLMRSSAAIACAGISSCIAMSHPGVQEGHLAATFEYEVKWAGAQRLAYTPVVGGGPDACTIHYSRNDKPVQSGQVVLMDAGCEYWGYTSDVTRTWPVSGRYSGPQRDVYELVLDVRRRCLEAVRPGATLQKVHALSVQLLSEGLRELGVLPGLSVDAIAVGPYREFYCHSVGHYLGCDVHDTNTAGPSRPLVPGVVLAVEPGLYIPNQPQYGPFAGIGVRIEDDVLVTQQGCQVLSDSVPVEVADVEALVGANASYRSHHRHRHGQQHEQQHMHLQQGDQQQQQQQQQQQRQPLHLQQDAQQLASAASAAGHIHAPSLAQQGSTSRLQHAEPVGRAADFETAADSSEEEAVAGQPTAVPVAAAAAG